MSSGSAAAREGVRPADHGVDARPVPELFEAVVGQPAVVEGLRSAARRPVHAYMFVGPPGTGSLTASRAFAAAILCPDGGCGRCETCRQALAGTHPDLVTIDRTGASLSVEEARALSALAQRRPFVAARQVLVVKDVHLATRSAPALLKTVEEPPPSTVFVLLADDIPPELTTVASRCVRIAFPPVPASAVTAWLVDREVGADAARLIAEGAGGDLDRARLLAEDAGYASRVARWRSVPALLDGHGATAARIARELLAAADQALEPLRAEHADELGVLTAESEALQERSVPGRKEVTDRQHREERRWRTDELRAGLATLARAYRDRLAARTSTPSGAEDTGTGPSSWATGSEAARSFERAIGLITEAATALQRNPNETLLLEALFVRLGRIGV